MGLQSELGYEERSANRLQRFLTAITSTRPGAWATYYLAAPLDNLIHRLSGRHTTLTRWFAGVEPVFITTTGARSGVSRTTPLFGIPVGEDLALIGTGVGQTPTPAWVHNLKANPAATVEYDGRFVDVVARLAHPEEESEAWQKARQIYPGFAEYPKWLDRPVSVFILEPA